MSESTPAGVPPLEPGDKATRVAMYTADTMLVGELVTKDVVRVSNWMRTPGLPNFVTLYSVDVVSPGSGPAPQVARVDEVHIPVEKIVAMHLAPPLDDKPEFDPSELNRKFEPVSAIVGPFRFDGEFRLPSHLTVTKQMSLLNESFSTLYNAEVSPAVEPLGAMRTSIVVLRAAEFLFAGR